VRDRFNNQMALPENSQDSWEDEQQEFESDLIANTNEIFYSNKRYAQLER
jgi:hypothetical protein